MRDPGKSKTSNWCGLGSVFSLCFAFLLTGSLCFVAFLPGPANAQAEPIRTVLPNGMTVILQENHAAPVVSIQVWVKAGSVDETEEQAGVAHVHEHMLFKGTKTRGVGTIAREVEAAGGEINAYTSWDTTVYYVNTASRFMDTGIDILADIMENATFDPQELSKEIQVILEEIRRGRDIPGRRLSEAFYAIAYKTHPYRRPVIGYEKTVRSFTRAEVFNFYRTWYVPENMVWVMAGDLDPEVLMPRLKKRLSRIPSHPSPPRRHVTEPPQAAPRVFVQPEDVKAVHLEMGFHIPGISHPDVPALDLLAQILGQGRSSRLYQALRMKERVVNSVSSYSMTPKDPGMLLVTATLEPPDFDKALKGMLDETFRFCFEPVKAEELRRAKAQIESDFIYQQETVQGQARELGYYEAVVGDLAFGKKYLDRIRAVQPADIQRVARNYLRPENLTLGVLVPESSQAVPPEKKLTQNIAERFAQLRSRFSLTSTSRQAAIHKEELSNGITLLVKENHAVPLVSLRAVFLGGLLSENPNNNGISNFVARMLTKGTSRRSAEQIARQTEALAASVSGFSGRDSIGLVAETVSWNFSPLFDIFSDLLLHPSFPDGFIEKTRQDILAAIKNQQDDLARMAFRLFWKALYPCHPYGMDILGTEESIRGITRQDLVDYYGRHAVSRNLVLAVVGDVETSDVRAEAERYLAELPDRPFLRSVKPCNTRPEGETIEEVSGQKLQAHIVMGVRGARHVDKDRYSLEVLEAVLSGQGGRLFVDLRDKQSLAYAVTAFNRAALEPGVFGIYIATAPEKRAAAIQGIREEIQRACKKRVSEEELKRAKRYLIGAFELNLQTNSAQAAAMAFNERYGLGYDAYLRYPARIQRVTARDVRRAAKRYLCSDILVTAEVVPEKNKR